MLCYRTWPVVSCTLLLPLVALATDRAAETDEAFVPAARFYSNPEERREAGIGTNLTDWLVFSGLVELEKGFREDRLQNNIATTEEEGPTYAVQAGFELTIFPWLLGEFVFEAEYDAGYFARTDEGLLAVEFESWGMKVGRLYVPFGEYYSHFVIGPLLEFGEIRETALVADYSFNDSFEVAAFVFDSDFSATNKNNDYDWGLALEFSSPTEAIRIGASYISDLAETDESLLEDHVYTYQRKVSGWSAYALIGFEYFEITAEVVQAGRAFIALSEAKPAFPEDQEDDNEEEDALLEKVTYRPAAYNLELAYYPQAFLEFAARIEYSDELEDAPEWRYGVSATWRPGKYFTVSLDYLYGTFKNGFVVDDNDNELQHNHEVALQVNVEF